MRNLQAVLIKLGEKTNELFNWISHKFSLPGEGSLWGGVTAEKFFTALVGIVVVLLIVAWLRRFIHRHIHRDADDAPQNWFHGLLEAVSQPLDVAIGIFGVYLALSPLLIDLTDQGGILLFVWALKFIFFVLFYWFLFRSVNVLDDVLKRRAQKTSNTMDDVLAPLPGKALHLLVPIAGVIAGIYYFHFPESWQGGLTKFVAIMIIAAVAWVAFQVIAVADKILLARYQINEADNLSARKVHTQIHVLQRIAFFLVGLFAVASALMLFSSVRQFGASILTSAGVVGIIIGFAAQRMIANLFAGIQLAFTQPIRLDDVVIVEGEWGRIEEITLTYVVVKIWDLRRLIVPISYFIEKPFQNWTRVSSDILGTVYLYMDYAVPVEEIRKELNRILKNNELWDGKTAGVQVTNSKETTVEIRVLVSASDASKAWNLRCEVREKLIAYVQKNYPQALPRVRRELTNVEEIKG